MKALVVFLLLGLWFTGTAAADDEGEYWYTVYDLDPGDRMPSGESFFTDDPREKIDVDSRPEAKDVNHQALPEA